MRFIKLFMVLLSMCASMIVAAVLLTWNMDILQCDDATGHLQTQTSLNKTAVHDNFSACDLPCNVEGTDLLIEQLIIYEGEFLENDAFGYVVNAVGILLRNAGDKNISYAEVRVKQNGQEYYFLAEYIPAGMTALVLEKDCRNIIPDAGFSCYGFVICDSDIWLPEVIGAEPAGKGDILLTNKSESALKHVCIYYRTRYNGDGFYLGGSVYSCCTEDLRPGEHRRITPEFYAGEYSTIVKFCIKMDEKSPL